MVGAALALEPGRNRNHFLVPEIDDLAGPVDMLRHIPIAGWAACAALVAALLIAILFGVNVGHKQDSISPNMPTRAAIGGPFSLIDQYGRRVTDRDFAGRPLAVFFGFTFCPEVCPTTLTDLSSMVSHLGSAGESLQVLFISVDHERDTPQKLKDYMTAFNPGFLALTGSADEIAQVARAYRVYYKRVEQDGVGSYTIDHTATVFLLDKRHLFVGTIDLHEDRNIGLAKLRRLVSEWLRPGSQ